MNKLLLISRRDMDCPVSRHARGHGAVSIRHGTARLGHHFQARLATRIKKTVMLGLDPSIH
jgi:hypothetical protein